jgi:hypothetical protein
MKKYFVIQSGFFTFVLLLLLVLAGSSTMGQGIAPYAISCSICAANYATAAAISSVDLLNVTRVIF